MLLLSLTMPMMELLWEKGDDLLISLVVFVFLQGDLYLEADPNKCNIITIDLAIW